MPAAFAMSSVEAPWSPLTANSCVAAIENGLAALVGGLAVGGGRHIDSEYSLTKWDCQVSQDWRDSGPTDLARFGRVGR